MPTGKNSVDCDLSATAKQKPLHAPVLVEGVLENRSSNVALSIIGTDLVLTPNSITKLSRVELGLSVRLASRRRSEQLDGLVMATTVVSRRNYDFHNILRSLCRWRRSLMTPPSLSSSLGLSAYENLPNSLLHRRPLPPFLTGSPLGQRLKFMESYNRFLCTTSSSPPPPSTTATNPKNSAALQSQANFVEDDKKTEESHQTGDAAGKSVRGGPVSWLSFFLLLATGAGIVYYYDKEKKRHIEEISNASNAVKQGPSIGKAAIGGPFNLVDHDGKNVTDRDFLGKWTLIYFGFTHCPDICPDELQKLAAAVDKIKGKSGIEIVPVFISVDPERDNVEQVNDYVKEFHPKLIGLTGNPDEIRKVARAYRVYYMKTAEEGSDYLVDHSIVMYLMGPDMDFVKFFGKNNDVDTLADGVITEIKQYKK
ncbi:hypothetical protein Nepgr_011560 [Nepenthes gracilis]|uniref:Thioredoxin domain-containing protein n=1 Tax=Nepenthes gracilis TaxID=150966 RepID=A0AAD3XMF1_NEPGR|nr:hypothetical protein Nepgr_011560 [Nepenthes gracilis]